MGVEKNVGTARRIADSDGFYGLDLTQRRKGAKAQRVLSISAFASFVLLGTIENSSENTLILWWRAHVRTFVQFASFVTIRDFLMPILSRMTRLNEWHESSKSAENTLIFRPCRVVVIQPTITKISDFPLFSFFASLRLCVFAFLQFNAKGIVNRNLHVFRVALASNQPLQKSRRIE